MKIKVKLLLCFYFFFASIVSVQCWAQDCKLVVHTVDYAVIHSNVGQLASQPASQQTNQRYTQTKIIFTFTLQATAETIMLWLMSVDVTATQWLMSDNDNNKNKIK